MRVTDRVIKREPVRAWHVLIKRIRRRVQQKEPDALRCFAGRSPEMRELVDFSVRESWSGQPVPGPNEFDRNDQRRKIWAP
jgi:hypothetical protein